MFGIKTLLHMKEAGFFGGFLSLMCERDTTHTHNYIHIAMHCSLESRIQTGL